MARRLLSERAGRLLRLQTNAIGITASPARLAHEANDLEGRLLQELARSRATERSDRLRRIWSKAARRASRRRVAAGRRIG